MRDSNQRLKSNSTDEHEAQFNLLKTWSTTTTAWASGGVLSRALGVQFFWRGSRPSWVRHCTFVYKKANCFVVSRIETFWFWKILLSPKKLAHRSNKNVHDKEFPFWRHKISFSNRMKLARQFWKTYFKPDVHL